MTTPCPAADVSKEWLLMGAGTGEKMRDKNVRPARR